MSKEKNGTVVELSKSLIGCLGTVAAALITGLFALIAVFAPRLSQGQTPDVPAARPTFTLEAALTIPTPMAPPPTVSPTSLTLPTLPLVPTATFTPVSSPAPTRVLTGTPPTGTLVLNEDFSNQATTWCRKTTGPIDVYCQDGELHLVSNGDHRWIGQGWYRDFIMQVQVRFIGDAGLGMLEFRATPASNPPHYIFSVSPAGYFGLYRAVPIPNTDYGNNVTLVEFAESPAIKKGNATNTFRVIAQGSRLTLFANDVQLASVEDGTVPEGRLGLGVGEGAHVVFDNLQVWVLPTPP